MKAPEQPFPVVLFIMLYMVVYVSVVCGSRNGAGMRALASHQCGPGSIPGLGVICGLSLLLVLVSAPRVFLQVLRFSSLHKNQHFQIPIRTGNSGEKSHTRGFHLFYLFIYLFIYLVLTFESVDKILNCGPVGFNKTPGLPSYASRFSSLSSVHFLHFLLQNTTAIVNRDRTITAAAPAAAMRVTTPSIRSFNKYFGVVQRVRSLGMQSTPETKS